jgi:hypothetical protein
MSSGPTPIWQSRLYQRRRFEEIATRIAEDRERRVMDGTLFREKRAMADHLIRLCDQAETAVRRRGGDIADDLERIDDLCFIVSTLDAEMRPGTDLDRLEELRSYLEAMVLAIEVARVADARGKAHPQGT